MLHFRELHENVLMMVFEERWLDFTVDDHDLLKAFIFTGHVLATPTMGRPGRYHLTLTQRGTMYLARLRLDPAPVHVEASLTGVSLRRASDASLRLPNEGG